MGDLRANQKDDHRSKSHPIYLPFLLWDNLPGSVSDNLDSFTYLMIVGFKLDPSNWLRHATNRNTLSSLAKMNWN